MKKKSAVTDSSDGGTDPAPRLDHRVVRPGPGDKKPWPKRDGCVGGSSSAGGGPGGGGKPLELGDLISLAVFAKALAGDPDVRLPDDLTIVLRTRRPIAKGAIIKESDVVGHVISRAVSTGDMYTDPKSVIGKPAAKAIPADKNLTRSMVH